MNNAIVPSSWLSEFGLSAKFNVELWERCDAAGVDPADLEQVRPIAAKLKDEAPHS